MALSTAERQRRSRERKRKKLKTAPDRASAFVQRPFSEFLSMDDDDIRFARSFIGETLDSVGMQLPDLTKDEDPEWIEGWAVPNRGSLGRAERMVDALIDSARMLAELINRHKLAEIDHALAELQTADLSDPIRRKQALADAAKLDKIRPRLLKEVRHAFPATTVKED